MGDGLAAPGSHASHEAGKPSSPSVSIPIAGHIYIQFSDDGAHIRKWAREPFDGGTAYMQAGSRDPIDQYELIDALKEIDRHVSHGKMGDWSIALDEIRKIVRAALHKGAAS